MKVLICCDYSDAGEHILHEAHKFLAAFPGVEILVYSVIDVTQVSVAGMYNNNEMLNALEQEGKELGKKAGAIFSGSNIRFLVEVGYPVEMVLQKAANLPADLLILGTHGRTGLGRILIGSVAENILRHAPCNTLVIPIKLKPGEQNTTA